MFKIRADTITPDLRKKVAKLGHARTLYEAGAKTVQREIIKHLRALQARGNEMGWPSQKFFAGGKDSVEKNVGISKVSDTGALITIADPRFAHRIEGGKVTPKRRKFLAIPLTAAAYALTGKGTLRESAPNSKCSAAGNFISASSTRIELIFGSRSSNLYRTSRGPMKRRTRPSSPRRPATR